MQIIKPDTKIDFVGRRYIAFALSTALILISIVSLIVQGGPKQGIDFAGGAEIIANFSPPAPIEKVKSALSSAGFDATVQKYGESTGADYRIIIAASQAENADLSNQVQKQLATGNRINRQNRLV